MDSAPLPVHNRDVIGKFETERLVAQRLSAAHLPDLCRLHRDARVMATLGGVRSDDATRVYLEANLKHWDEHGFGLYVLSDKTDRRVVGRAGLRHVELDGVREVELAYALAAEYWGLGLASEVGGALVSIGFDALRLQNIVAFTMTTNRASRRVMEKLGFAYEREFERLGLPHALYRIVAPRC